MKLLFLLMFAFACSHSSRQDIKDKRVAVMTEENAKMLFHRLVPESAVCKKNVCWRKTMITCQQTHKQKMNCFEGITSPIELEGKIVPKVVKLPTLAEKNCSGDLCKIKVDVTCDERKDGKSLYYYCIWGVI